MFLFAFLFLILHVFADPLPSGLIDSSIDENSISIDFNNLAGAGCTPKTSSNDFSNEDVEDDLNIFRRESNPTSTFCPSGLNADPKPPRAMISPDWRAPGKLPVLNPKDLSIGNPRDIEFCSKQSAKLLVSCAGPEVWYYSSDYTSQVLGYVLNCIDGKFRFH